MHIFTPILVLRRSGGMASWSTQNLKPCRALLPAADAFACSCSSSSSWGKVCCLQYKTVQARTGSCWWARCVEVDGSPHQLYVATPHYLNACMHLVLGAAPASVSESTLASRVLFICSCTHNSATVQASQRLQPCTATHPPCTTVIAVSCLPDTGGPFRLLLRRR
jgi:hypothetical protein